MRPGRAWGGGLVALALAAGVALLLLRGERWHERTSAVGPAEVERPGAVQPLTPAERPQAARVESAEVAPERVAADARIRVSGRVVDEQGLPVETVTVQLRRRVVLRKRSTWEPERAATTDARGAFSFPELAAQEWSLYVHGQGLVRPVEELVDGTRGDRALEIGVQRGHELFVRVREPGGELCAKGIFQVVHGDWTKAFHLDLARREPDGCWRLDGLPAGELELQAQAEEASRALVASARVTLPTAERLELRLEPVLGLLTLRGNVRDPSGSPLEGVRIQCVRRDQARWLPVTTDSAGAFELRELAPGTVSLSVFKPGYHLSGSEDHGLEHELVPDGDPLELVLLPVAEVRGQVLDAAGRPVARARVLGGGASQGPGERFTDELGRFTLAVTPGKRVLYALAPGHAPSRERALELRSGEVVEELVLQLRPACRVVGRVLDAAGAPFPGASILVGDHVVRDSDARGEFVLDALPPEPLRLGAQDDDGGLALVTLTPVVGVETRLELRFEPRQPVRAELRFLRGGAPGAFEVSLGTRGFWRPLVTSAADTTIALELQTPGPWRATVHLSGADRGELSAWRLLEFQVPAGATFQATFDWDAARPPASREELGGWLIR